MTRPSVEIDTKGGGVEKAKTDSMNRGPTDRSLLNSTGNTENVRDSKRAVKSVKDDSKKN